MNAEAMREVIGNPAMAVIERTFGRIECVERVLAETGHATDAIGGEVFRLSRPTEVLSGATDRVYAAHVRELLARVEAGQDTRPGTDAEIIMAMSETCLAVPLKGDSVAAYARVFARLWPEKAAELATDIRESYAGAAAEIEESVRHCIRADWRRAEQGAGN